MAAGEKPKAQPRRQGLRPPTLRGEQYFSFIRRLSGAVISKAWPRYENGTLQLLDMKGTMKRLLCALALTTAASGINAQALDFKGIALGAELDAVKAANPRLNCRVASDAELPVGDSICTLGREAGETIAGAPALFMLVGLYDRKVASIAVKFPERSFDQVAAALVERYGKPRSDETSTTQNRAGATFGNRELEWDGIRLQQRAGKIDESIFVMRSAGSLAEFQRRKAGAAKAGARDL
jgi:hypothetical protein